MPDNDLTLDDLLVGLIEECSEVIHAATKCLRFGFDRTQPGYGHNAEVLAKEIGEVLRIIDALPLPKNVMLLGSIDKIERMKRAKAEFGRAG